MKILFVASGNHFGGINPNIKAQAEYLMKLNVSIEYFPVIGKGFKGYAKSIFLLNKHLKRNNNYDLIHAHYSLCGYLAALAGAKPVIVSLMGSDIKNFWNVILIMIFNRFFWDALIVKSERMRNKVGLKGTIIIPNGVDLGSFYPISKENAIEILKWDKTINHVLFGSNPSRPEKNYKLCEVAIGKINNLKIQIHTLVNVPHDQVIYYLNASNIVTLPSHWEGSPNIIKEALACNCPVVASDVGDVSWIIGDVRGCFISSSDIEDYTEKLKMALSYSRVSVKTNGRDKINELGLDSHSISQKILKVYKKIVGRGTR